jgi:hypothetical protein
MFVRWDMVDLNSRKHPELSIPKTRYVESKEAFRILLFVRSVATSLPRRPPLERPEQLGPIEFAHNQQGWLASSLRRCIGLGRGPIRKTPASNIRHFS